eukprot:SAG31_NODE_3954_length_3721_cov_2.949475_5_plen_65_part_00
MATPTWPSRWRVADLAGSARCGLYNLRVGAMGRQQRAVRVAGAICIDVAICIYDAMMLSVSMML